MHENHCQELNNLKIIINFEFVLWPVRGYSTIIMFLFFGIVPTYLYFKKTTSKDFLVIWPWPKTVQNKEQVVAILYLCIVDPPISCKRPFSMDYSGLSRLLYIRRPLWELPWEIDSIPLGSIEKNMPKGKT